MLCCSSTPASVTLATPDRPVSPSSKLLRAYRRLSGVIHMSTKSPCRTLTPVAPGVPDVLLFAEALSAIPFGSVYLSGRTRLSEAGPTAASDSGLRKLVRASGTYPSLARKTTLGPHATFPGLLSVLDSQM